MLKIGDKIQCIFPFISSNGNGFYHDMILTISYIDDSTDSLNLIEPGRMGYVIITRDELKQYFKSYPIIANTTNDSKSDDLDDALGLPTGPLPIGSAAQPNPWGGFNFISSNPGYSVTLPGGLKFDTDLFTTKKCDCGSAKTYGEQCGPDMHSSWCQTMEDKK